MVKDWVLGAERVMGPAMMGEDQEGKSKECAVDQVWSGTEAHFWVRCSCRGPGDPAEWAQKAHRARGKWGRQRTE